MRYISFLLVGMLFSLKVMGDVPNAPLTLIAQAVSSSQINLFWSDNSTNELWFVVERGQTITSFSQVGTTTINSYNATSLSSNGTYYFRVCAYNLDGNSSYSNIAQATTFGIPPVVPSSLNAEAISNSQINLSWSDNSYNETGFVIERKTTGAFTTIGYSSQNVATYTDLNLSPQTTYYYRVAAYNQYGTSTYSNTTNATTPYLNYISLPFTWQIQTVESQDDIGAYSSIACDSSGKPHISYTGITTGRLRYAYWNGSTWTIACVGTTSSSGYHTSMDLDSSNRPHISHYNATNQKLLYTKVIENFGTFGTSSSIVDSPNVGKFSSLKLDADGDLNISYYDEKNKALKYAFWAGAYWTTSTIDYDPSTATTKKDRGRFSSLFLIEDSLPCMSYYDATDGDLRFAWWNTTTWGSRTIDTAGDVGQYSSIVGTAGAIRIAYYDATNTNLKYVVNSDGTWTIWILDSSGDVGKYCSIGVDNSNSVYISYYDATNKDLKIAYGSGSTWGIQIIDSDGDVGMYSSLAVYNGVVHIAYYDQTNGNLKYATIGTATPPNVPSNLVATAISSSTINLSWSDNSTNESYFIIERGNTITTFTQIGTTTLVTYTDTLLPTNTTYYYRIYAWNFYGTSSYSNTASATTFNLPIIAPSNLAATGTGPGSITLSWNDNSTNELWFVIERGSTITAFSQIGTITFATWTNTGFLPHTTYYYRVMGQNQYGTSGYSNIASATTINSIPNFPSTLTAEALSSSTINLSWVDNSSNEDWFIIERGETNTTFSFVGTTTLATYTNTGLSSNTIYYYRVASYNSVGTSAYSNIASATTWDVSPLAPSDLAATSTSTSTITLSWTDNSTNEFWFVVERGSTITAFSQIGTITLVTYTDTGLLKNTTYYYRVYAWNLTGGSSSYSNIASATTYDISPNPPSTLTVQAISNSQINLFWLDNSDNEQGFLIERMTTGTFTIIGFVSSNTTAYSNLCLSPNTTYYYRLAGWNDFGTSAYSNTASATTFLTTLYLSPSLFVIGSGSTSTVKVMIDNVVGMVGASVYLSFDPNVLEVATITYGEFPSTETLSSSFNNASGTIIYSAALLTGSSTGSGTIANIEFKGKSSGTSAISFEVSTNPNIKKTNLIDNNGSDIPFNYINAFSSSTIMGSLTGKIVSSVCNTTFMEFAGIVVGLSGIGTTTTNGSSSFSFTNVPIGTHTLWADTYGAGSITTQIYVGTETDLGTLTMIAGDTDDSGQVNLTDFYRFRTEFGSTAVGLESNFDHDGTVTLSDFYILRQNFGKTRALSILGTNDNVLLSIEPLKDGFEIKIANVSSLIAATIDLLLPLGIEPIKIEKGDFLSSFSILEEKITLPKVKYTLALLSSERAGTGTIAILRSKGAGNITFGIETKLMDNNGKWIPFKTSIIIVESASAAVKIEPMDSTIFINETKTIGVSMEVFDTIGANIEILYPSFQLEVLNIKKGDFGDVFLFSTETSKITLIGVKLGSPTNGFFTLANITFKGKKEGTASLLFSLVDIRDSNNAKKETKAFSGTITIRKYIVGDINEDGELSFDDLMLITTNWKGSNTVCDIGPASGIPPNLISNPDGVIDFEDLMVFCLMWNWKNSGFGVRGSGFGDSSIWIEREGGEFVVKYSGEPLLGGHIVLSVDGFSTVTSPISPFLFEFKRGRLVIDFAVLNGSNGEIARLKASSLKFEKVDMRDSDNQTINIQSYGLASPTNFDSAICYPNPTRVGWVKFKDIPLNTRLLIYNIAGELVLEKESLISDEEVSLNKIAPGVYIYILQNGTSKKCGKIGVVK